MIQVFNLTGVKKSEMMFGNYKRKENEVGGYYFIVGEQEAFNSDRS